MADIYYEPNTNGMKSNRRWFHNVKLIGELDNGTSLYIEDYVYTYLYQYATSDLSYESSAVLIGEHYQEVSQIVIYGLLPIGTNILDTKSKWMSREILDKLGSEKERYFPQGEYVGWMHTQPGYGIMLTTQETKTHREVFGEEGVLLLIDPIHKVETFFSCENGELIQRRGFCMYYERNEQMQQYMMDNPIVEKQKNEVNDDVVVNFREIGARRKRESERRRKMNMVVSLTLTFLLLGAALITGIYEQQRKISELEKDVINIHQQYNNMEYQLKDNPVELVFNEQEEESTQDQHENNPNQEEIILEKVAIEKEEEEPIDDIPLEETPKEEPEKPETPKEREEINYDIHAVQTGDSLLDISYKYYKTVKMANKIAELNNLTDRDTIYIGQKLKLPRISQ